MKDDRTTEYLDSLKNVAMRDEVRLTMREELEAYADLHSAQAAEESRHDGMTQKYSVFAILAGLNTRHMQTALLIALMVTAGGTSFAAQNAVPGELLYPVKIGLNENLRGAVAFDANAKAELHAALLAERLEEAQTLADEGRLEGSLAIQVRKNIEAQFDRTYLASAEANAEVGALVRSQIAQSRSTFQSTLENGVLAQADGDAAAGYGDDAVSTMSTFEASIAMEESADIAGDEGEVSMMRTTKLAGEIDIAVVVESAEARLKALQKTIAETAEFDAEVREEFEAQLQDAEVFVITAKAQLAAGTHSETEESVWKASEILGEIESALSLMGQVEIDMNTGHIIGIDLSEEVYTDLQQNDAQTRPANTATDDDANGSSLHDPSVLDQ